MRNARIWLPLALLMALSFSLLGFSSGVAIPSQAVPAPGGGNQPVDVIITFKDAPRTDQLNYIGGLGGRVSRQYQHIHAVSASVPRSMLDTISKYSNVVRVESAGGKVQALDNPPIPVTQPQTIPWGIARVNAPQVQAFDKGTGVKVAIIDTGIDTSQADLQVAGGVAIVSCVQNAISNCVNPYDDDNSHGTHVSGTIAALDNGIGVLGMAPNVSLYAVKVLDSNGSGSWPGVAAGIDWAISNHMQVISMSLGGGAPCISGAPPSAVHSEISAAYNAGIVIVAAAGNSGSQCNNNNVNYPAAYPEVIAVAATCQPNTSNSFCSLSSLDTRASFSSQGPQVDLAAPGVDILSTTPGNTLSHLSGTSMATPHVSGLAALLLASGQISDTNADGRVNDEVRQRMEQTATDLGASGWDPQYGYGLINAAAAVTPPVAPKVPGAPTNVVATAGNTQATVTWNAPASNGGSPITGYTVTGIPSGSCSVANVLSCTVTGLTNGTSYTFTVTATNAVGTGPASAPSNSVTPTSAATVPGAPTNVVATAGNTQATVTWAAPASNGGSPITGYTVTSSPGGLTVTVGGGTLSAMVTGLTNGTAYTFSVTATNAVGTGPASAPSNAVTPVNQPPVANAGPDQAVNLGAPVTLNGSASFDPDGSITSYQWSFGDGASASGATVTHTYAAGGVYTATLTVTDNQGATGQASARITVVAPANLKIHIGAISAKLYQPFRGWTTYDVVTVNVVDGTGAAVAGVTVTGQWSGATTGTVAGTTDAGGNVQFTSPTLRRPPAGTTFTFTVTNLTKSGYTYDAGSNVQNSVSVTV